MCSVVPWASGFGSVAAVVFAAAGADELPVAAGEELNTLLAETADAGFDSIAGCLWTVERVSLTGGRMTVPLSMRTSEIESTAVGVGCFIELETVFGARWTSEGAS